MVGTTAPAGALWVIRVRPRLKPDQPIEITNLDQGGGGRARQRGAEGEMITHCGVGVLCLSQHHLSRRLASCMVQ